MNSIPSTNSRKNESAGSQRHKRARWLIALVLLIAIAAAAVWPGQRLWPGGLSQALLPLGKGLLEVRLKDHREAIGDFLTLEIRVDIVRIHPKGALRKHGWLLLNPVTEKIDLTRYTARDSALIFRGKVATGLYEAIDLKLKGINGTLKETKEKTAVGNLVDPIRLGFSVNQKASTLIVLDLTVIDMSDHPGRGYELHIKGYQLYTNGKLIQTH